MASSGSNAPPPAREPHADARTSGDSTAAPSNLELHQLTELAQTFAAQKRLDEAISCLEIAQRTAPQNVAIKLQLAELRDQARAASDEKAAEIERNLAKRLRRDAIDSAHFLGLADLYLARNQPAQAAGCLELLRRRDALTPFGHKRYGRVLGLAGRWAEAAQQYRTARRFNPFDRDLAEHLSEAEEAAGRLPDALRAAIDAYLLLDGSDSQHAARLSARIRSLQRDQQHSKEEIEALFAEHRERLQTAFDRLEWQRIRFLESQGTADGALSDETVGQAHPSPAAQAGDPLAGAQEDFQIAGRLRGMARLRQLDNEQMLRLSIAVRVESYRRGEIIVRQGSPGGDLFLIEDGALLIQRDTPMGPFRLGVLRAGEVIGEINHVARATRSSDVVAAEDCTLLRVRDSLLVRLLEAHPRLAVAFYQLLWRSLADKLRHANSHLERFFRNPEHRARIQAPQVESGKPQEVRMEARMAVLREQGLSGEELNTLARASNVRSFADGELLFREGDVGSDMYIVLEGRVRISKTIPGVGEEALAILDRGDFFGEMALIDGHPRSADARAHEGPVTAILFGRRTLQQVLAMDPRAAKPFLYLLCRLICERLRGIDEKLTTWRIMVGGGMDASMDDDPFAMDAAPSDDDASGDDDGRGPVDTQPI